MYSTCVASRTKLVKANRCGTRSSLSPNPNPNPNPHPNPHPHPDPKPDPNRTLIAVAQGALRGHTGRVRDVVLKPGTSLTVLSCGDDMEIRWWDITGSGSCLQVLSGHKAPCTKLATLGFRLYSGDTNGIVRCWAVDSGSLVWESQHHREAVHAVAVNNKELLTISRDVMCVSQPITGGVL